MICADDKKFSFSISTVNIVEEVESVGSDDSGFLTYYLTRYVRNQHGEYSLFKVEISHGLETPTPYIKYIDQKMARFLLKEKYVDTPIKA